MPDAGSNERFDAFTKRFDAFIERFDSFVARMDAHIERMDRHLEEANAHNARGNEIIARCHETFADLKAFTRDLTRRNEVVLQGMMGEIADGRAQIQANTRAVLSVLDRFDSSD